MHFHIPVNPNSDSTSILTSIGSVFTIILSWMFDYIPKPHELIPTLVTAFLVGTLGYFVPKFWKWFEKKLKDL